MLTIVIMVLTNNKNMVLHFELCSRREDFFHDSFFIMFLGIIQLNSKTKNNNRFGNFVLHMY